jgi:isopenicillin N synthase-like dioxygenase
LTIVKHTKHFAFVNTNRIQENMVQFFDLPSEEKQSVDSSLSPHVRGFSQLGKERTVGVMDVREVWEMGPDAEALKPKASPFLCFFADARRQACTRVLDSASFDTF